MKNSFPFDRSLEFLSPLVQNFCDVKILIVGYGSIGKKHHRIIRMILPQAKIFLLRHDLSRDETRGDIEASILFADFLEKPHVDIDIDIAILANPSSMREAILEKLIDAKCHIFIEKPIASRITENLVRLLSKAKDRGCVIQVGYHLRFNDSLVFLKELIANVPAENVYSVSVEVGQNLELWRPSQNYRSSVSASAELGGGVLLELSHEIDYLIWFFGGISWVWGWADKVSQLDIDVEDTARLIIGFEHPYRHLTASVHMDFVRADSIRRFCICCNDETFVWDGLKNSVTKYSSSETESELVFSGSVDFDVPFKAQFLSFLRAIHHCDYDSVALDQALATVKVIQEVKNFRPDVRFDGVSRN